MSKAVNCCLALRSYILLQVLMHFMLPKPERTLYKFNSHCSYAFLTSPILLGLVFYKSLKLNRISTQNKSHDFRDSNARDTFIHPIHSHTLKLYCILRIVIYITKSLVFSIPLIDVQMFNKIVSRHKSLLTQLAKSVSYYFLSWPCLTCVTYQKKINNFFSLDFHLMIKICILQKVKLNASQNRIAYKSYGGHNQKLFLSTVPTRM